MANTTASGLIYSDQVVGAGAEASAGKTVEVHYTGWLYINGVRGNQFDSSIGRGPFQFGLGAGQVIKGWDEGVQLLNPGSKGTFYIPSSLGYGAVDRGPIPANSILVFDVELLKAE